jgi:hypothetical protein
MNELNTILQSLDNYFERASPKEIEEDLRKVNDLKHEGVTFEEYIQTLNLVSASNIIEVGVCDDIAFADLFNESILNVRMGDISQFKLESPTFVRREDLRTKVKTLNRRISWLKKSIKKKPSGKEKKPEIESGFFC